VLDEVLVQLASTGATVVVFTGFDPRGRLPFGRILAARAATYNDALMTSASQVGARVVDLWHLEALYRDDILASRRPRTARLAYRNCGLRPARSAATRSAQPRCRPSGRRSSRPSVKLSPSATMLVYTSPPGA
jgi:hypothetical protein